MISVYKGLFAIYWIVAIICVVAGTVLTLFFPEHIIAIILVMFLILLATLMVLMKVTHNKFKMK